MGNLLGVYNKKENFKFDDSQVSESVDFGKLLLFKLRDATMLGTYRGHEDEYYSAVEMIDIMLTPDQDEIYNREMEGLKIKVLDAANRGLIKKDDDALAMKKYSGSWLRVLMRLMKRKGYISREQVNDWL